MAFFESGLLAYCSEIGLTIAIGSVNADGHCASKFISIASVELSRVFGFMLTFGACKHLELVHR